MYDSGKDLMSLEHLHKNALLDYYYIHSYYETLFELNFCLTQGHERNYIILFYQSSCLKLFYIYKKIRTRIITDIFIIDTQLPQKEQEALFSLYFIELFWLKIEKVSLNEKTYPQLVKFLFRHENTLNKLDLDTVGLEDSFCDHFLEGTKLETLSFLSLHNNKLTTKFVEGFIPHINFKRIEYLCLSKNLIDNSGVVKIFQAISQERKCRILDISYNNFEPGFEDVLLELIVLSGIRELYVYGYVVSEDLCKKIEELLLLENTDLRFLGISLDAISVAHDSIAPRLIGRCSISFDIVDSGREYESTVYLKALADKAKILEEKSSQNFHFLNEDDLIGSFTKIEEQYSDIFSCGKNLFLFDIHDYNFISALVRKYSFNYIYIENYYISYNDLVLFFETIAMSSIQDYKVNLMSCEIDNEQLEYILENMPKNIFYVELNLNKIDNKSDYISRLLDDGVYIFESMELYQKERENEEFL